MDLKSIQKRILIVFLALGVSGILPAQIPAGYYDGTEGLTGESLRSALFQIITDHTELSYSSLWTHFQTTDKKANGTVWDMYSDVPGGNPAYTYAFITDQCGNYSGEGDCYNREHSFPKSWFNDGTPMITDLFHIYPTDGYVNGMRSNYPYGEVGAASWTSTNGSRLGANTYPGYSGTVFEPIDEYKGDFARTYFYMVTCYLDRITSWSSPMLSGDNLSEWAGDMLVQWSEDDPVSSKETARNNAVYLVQHNRNPYIDHPEWIGEVWGSPSAVTDIVPEDFNTWYHAGHLYIETGTEKGSLSVKNITGQEIFRVDQVMGSVSYPVSLPPSFYIISFIGDTFRCSRKVLITGYLN